MPTNQGYQKVSTEAPMADSSRIASRSSSQQLMPPDTASVSASLESGEQDKVQSPYQYHGLRSIGRREWFTVSVLCFVNLINYMDRFTIAGVLTDIQQHFDIRDDQSGLLQTAFVLSYMICAPIFGYLGDRYSRRWIMALGVALWSGTTLLGSFMNQYGWFLTFRALVGIGEASYSTIAPTIISDLFISDMRSKMLAFFYFAIPVGSGLGYIIGSETAKLMGTWRWALRVTPILGAVAVVMIWLCKEPQRGQSEGSHNLVVTSYREDLKDIVKNPSFMLSTAGFTCVSFVAGALAWWGPTFMHFGIQLQPGNEDISLSSVSFMFGGVALLSGAIGVPLGSYLSQVFKKRYPRCDPIICALGLLISVPLIAAAMIVVSSSTAWAVTLIFFAELALNLNWAIVADILLYVVMPTRRSTAEAFQILVSHALGDAGSPYLVGVISEAVKSLRRTEIATALHEEIIEASGNNSTIAFESIDDSKETKFVALQYALFATCVVEVLGAVFFLITSFYVTRDRERAKRAIADGSIEEIQHQDADRTSSSSVNS
ncbi:protein spinster isoform X1 [Phlebotomus argentipes]|uniref:protein spinster isoform X1 n=1 Tax=Phlebotomus argentipes TaxID=94469 RepID=UPI002892A864|nr:protein spinster isoform X1 [Phlebotomus argentipes]